MPAITWYFDFISPFAYFGLQWLDRLPAGTAVTYQPILFAGLLEHWEQKGPAEIAPKRTWTYRSCIWLARQHGIPFQMPAAHPFNSLPFLRLAIAAGNTLEAIRTIYSELWSTGADPADANLVSRLATTLGVDPGRLAEPAIKASLREETERAAERGVFGVPSFYVDGEVFWGSDSVDFVAEYLRHPALLADPAYRRADALPVAASRRAVT